MEGDDKESTVEGTINAVAKLVDKVPVYDDAIKPVAKEAGKALETVGKTVNAALMPIRGLVWGMEQIEEFVQTKVTKKLEDVPPENIQTPDLSVAGPAIESLRFTGHKESLSDLYASLLATSMDKTTAKIAHPGFVEIIRNLSSDEAKIISYMKENSALPVIDIRKEKESGESGITIRSYVCTIGIDAGCEHLDLIDTYLKNLERLGLIDIPRERHLTDDGVYDRILNEPHVKRLEQEINAMDGFNANFEKYYIIISSLGHSFVRACVKN